MRRLTRSELRGRGKMGFAAEDYEEWLKRGAERREDIQAHEIALERMRETGATGREEIKETGLGRRLGVKEAGLGERLGREQEFARPLRTAEIERRGAQAISFEKAGELAGVRAEMGRRTYPLYGQEETMGKLGIKRAQSIFKRKPLEYEDILKGILDPSLRLDLGFR